MARVGYFAGSSCADAEVFAAAVRAINPRHARIRELPPKVLMDFDSLRYRWRKKKNEFISKPRDVNMQHGGLAVIQRSEAAVDCGSEIVRLRDAFAMRAECPCYGGEIPLLALTPRCQPRLKLFGFGGNALWINPLHRGLHRLPAAIVQHYCKNPNLILLRPRIDACGRGAM